MQTTPCGTTRFSRFLRNSFLRLDVFAGAAGAAASCGSLATVFSLALSKASDLKTRAALSPFPRKTRRQRSSAPTRTYLFASRCLLLGGGGALARTLTGAGVGMRLLAAHRKVAAVAQTAVALNFDQPPDVHLHFLAQIALDA